MIEKSFPTQEVRAIGRKLGVDGSDSVEDLLISLMDASFHVEGTVEQTQQRLKMLCRVIKRAGHFFEDYRG